jgi:hypothetical protein
MSVDILAKNIQQALSVIHNHVSNSEDRRRAQESLDQVMSPTNVHMALSASLQLLHGQGAPHDYHFALSTISKYVGIYGNDLGVSEWGGLKSGLLELLQRSSNTLPYFVSSKLVDVIVDVAIRIWPNDWQDLLSVMLQISPAWTLCLFGRLCDTLSDDSLSVRCIAPARQLALRTGIATVSDMLCNTCIAVYSNGTVSATTHLQWIVELVRGLAIATKQSSHLIHYGLHDVILSIFAATPDPTLKALCAETLSYFIQFLNGQSGRSYTLPRGTRDEETSMLNGVIRGCASLALAPAVSVYFEQDEVRDSVREFLELLTDIRKTSNIFSYLPNLEEFSQTLIGLARNHPSVLVQISALGNVDSLLRTKNIAGSRDIYMLCFLLCHDYYTSDSQGGAIVPPVSIFPEFPDTQTIRLRRELFEQEVEEEDTKPNDLVGKLRNATTLCLKHLTTNELQPELLDFMKAILTECINSASVGTKSYKAALYFTDAVASSVEESNPQWSAMSNMVDIIVSNPPDESQLADYLWFIGRAGRLISSTCLQKVFEYLLQRDIVKNFPVQVAFIALCKTNRNSAQFAMALHQGLQQCLGGESRSWAVGAILSATSHGGAGASDEFARVIYTETKSMLDSLISQFSEDLGMLAKRCGPVFATFKALLEAPLNDQIMTSITDEVATTVIPFFWTKVVTNQTAFTVGQNEYLSVVGSQFTPNAKNTISADPAANACFQLFLGISQVAGLCLSLTRFSVGSTPDTLAALFDPSWGLRPSLVNVLLTNVAHIASHTKPQLVMQSILPRALASIVNFRPTEDFGTVSLSRAQVSVVQVILSALRISNDDDLVMTEFTGGKAAPSQRQIKAQRRSQNRFAVLETGNTESVVTARSSSSQVPSELLSNPDATFSVLQACFGFRNDKALRRICQSSPTILSRWWNSVSPDAGNATAFVTILPGRILRPIVELLVSVRDNNPLNQPGGILHSFTCDRAVAGRKITSELVDHSASTIFSMLTILWKFALRGRPGNTVDPMNVVASCQPLYDALRLITEASQLPVSPEVVSNIIGYIRAPTLENKAGLKYFLNNITSSSTAGRGDVIGATQSDIATGMSERVSGATDVVE